MKTYRGSPGAARCYVEADRSRADDYYLAEGTGVAERYAASPDTGLPDSGVRALSPLTGEKYEAWVAGVDPVTGVAKGRVRQDASAVRFVEVIVNGPKSWSLAAALHPDVSAALDAAQDRAAKQIIGWLAQHATTRVGPRGGQVQVPVSELEAAVIRHYTSRAGDPHRHLHLQINARVRAAGTWRGLHTVGVRDSLNAVNGIGHAAVVTDPQFRGALAEHGYTLDQAGEIVQLAPHVGAFSRRAAQIAARVDRYQAEWAAAHPDEQAGPALRRAWDARAWADGRPDKVIPRSAAELHRRWLHELAELGYRDHDHPVRLMPLAVGQVDRNRAVEVVLTRLASGRSAWNAADIRGEVEQYLARAGIVTDAAVRVELAEDLTARTLGRCVSLLDDAVGQARAVPEHVRALTSSHVLEVEADLVARFAARADAPAATVPALDLSGAGGQAVVEGGGRSLDRCQVAAVTTLTSAHRLVVIEGAAGAGKTSVLTAAREQLTAQGLCLVVVTPTLKAAQVASRDTGATAGSAAGFAHQHGWRWTDDGDWTRLTLGEFDSTTGTIYRGPKPGAVLRPGDVLVVDEAGMLDQDTARALLMIADEHDVRVALLGDRRQLTAVGRGGLLDLAARWAAPDARVELSEVHRFARHSETDPGVTVPDEEYAQLSLAMRRGEHAAGVFDALLERGQIAVHPTTAAQVAAVADAYVTAQHHRPGKGRDAAVIADTGEQVDALNTAIRDRLAAAGRVEDTRTVSTSVGVRIGVGDRVATRRNDPQLQVANRDTWTVTGIDRHGAVSVVNAAGRRRTLPVGYVREHVDLAYACTVYGVQGDTVTAGHLVIGEHTGAAAGYVGMTRGRQHNTAHLVADSVEAAREQWCEVFARDRADLGPGHAREAALREAANYAATRPLDELLGELRQAWTTEARCLEQLEHAVPVRDALREIVPLRRAHDDELAAVDDRYQQARAAAAHAEARVEHSTAVMARQADQLRDQILHAWDTQRDDARAAAAIVLAGPGRLGLRLLAVNRATEQLGCWSAVWQPYLPDLPVDTAGIAHYANHYLDPHRLHAAFDDYAHRQVAHAHPEHAELEAAATAANQRRDQAWHDYTDTSRRHDRQLNRYGSLGHTHQPERRLHDVDRTVTATETKLADTRRAITRLTGDPAIAALPAGHLADAHDEWSAGYQTDRAAEGDAATLRALRRMDAGRRRVEHQPIQHVAFDNHRDGPSIGR